MRCVLVRSRYRGRRDAIFHRPRDKSCRSKSTGLSYQLVHQSLNQLLHLHIAQSHTPCPPLFKASGNPNVVVTQPTTLSPESRVISSNVSSTIRGGEGRALTDFENIPDPPDLIQTPFVNS